ncbi:MAG: hypothetical protein DRO67_09360 [Candidatus Asgardarchaeum californiense]|nr:MAG: hypothetical protein DRO67_09360 [Candidatus Asgardarchaeum californiense]
MEIEIPFEEMEAEVGITLQSLRVPSKKDCVVPDVSVQFVCEEFGVVISVINRADYSYIRKTVKERYPDYRYVFVSTYDNLIEKRDQIVWTLMKGGFMTYIRQNFPRQFQQLMTDGFGNKIIRERLRRWNDEPKFKFFIDENVQAMDAPVTMVLATEPAFFDYMP